MALVTACIRGDVEIVKILLNFGAQVNVQTNVRCTDPMATVTVFAVHCRFFNAQEVDDTGITPLTVACVTGRTRIAKILIEHGAIVNFIDKVWKIFKKSCFAIHLYTVVHII